MKSYKTHMNKAVMRILKSIAGFLVVLFGFYMLVGGCEQKVFAASQPTVFTDTEKVEKLSDGEYLVPIYISGNSGLMGFRISLACESDTINIYSVSKGSVTKNGNFSSNVSSGGSKSVDILWNNVDAVKTDGTLAYVVVSVLDKAETEIRINVSFDQMDTFDEEYMDVYLVCKNIVINLGKNGVVDTDIEETTEEITEEETTESETTEEITDDTTEEITEDITEAETTETIESIDDEVSTEVISVDDKEEELAREAAKKDAKTSKVENKISDEDIHYAVCLALANYGVTGIDRIPEGEKDAFYELIKMYLKKYCHVSALIVNKLDIANIIEQLVLTDADIEMIEKLIKDGIPDAEQTSLFGVSQIIYIVAGVVIIVLIGLLVWRSSHSKNKRKEQEK